MGRNSRLEINVGVKEPVVANDLKLEGTGEGGGENEGGRSSGNHDAIDHIIVLINQLQQTAVARRLERQHVTVNIYGRRDNGGFWETRFCGVNLSRLKGNWVARGVDCVHKRGQRKDAENC